MATMVVLKKMAWVVVVVVVLMCTVAAKAAIPCDQAVSRLSPCVSYLTGKSGGTVPATCCNGITSIKNASPTTADRQAVCRCLKSAAAGISGLNYGLASSLPGKCGLFLPIRIEPNIDCSRVN